MNEEEYCLYRSGSGLRAFLPKTELEVGYGRRGEHAFVSRSAYIVAISLEVVHVFD